MRGRTRTGGGEIDRGIGLIALLLMAILVPTACVLWFMNEALTNQAAAARQDVLEAYRGQLRLVRSKIDAEWQARAAALQGLSELKVTDAFRRVVSDDRADSVVLLGESGGVLYPSAGSRRVTAPDPRYNAARALEMDRNHDAADAYSVLLAGETNPSRAARAAQGLVRSLWRRGNRDGAVRAIERHFVDGPAARGLDREGRLIAADAYLLAAQLLEPGDRRNTVINRLSALLNDYETPTIPSAQRLFLMSELSAVLPHLEFPTRDAERLGLSVIEAGSLRPDDAGLRLTSVPGVWQLASGDGRIIALYRDEAVNAIMTGLLAQHSSAAGRFEMIPPGRPPDDEAIVAGASLPGWQISFALPVVTAPSEVARSRRAAYLWIGALAIGITIAVIAGLGHALSRHARLARLKTDLVAAVSHELRTPLASMRLLVDSLLSDQELDAQKTRDYLQLMAGENARLSRMIENFLTFSRLDRNRYRFSFTPTTPADVVQAALEASRERMPGDCELEVDVAQDLPAVSVDPDALVTALVNLLDNAWKYTADDKRVTVRAFKDGGDVVFAVQDRGIGISPREQKRIFHRFYQVDQRLSRETGGCGLGLSIVQSIVRAHGGTVRVESVPLQGSTFALRVPCSDIVTG
jgi:signal transduction histidine kinase